MSTAALVVGCGSIGLRHIGNLRALGVDPILAFDPDPASLAAAVERFSVEPCRRFEEGLDRRPAAALICTPPAGHIPAATQAVDAGCHLFIEKPLSQGLAGVDALLEKARRAGRVVSVGYNLRFEEGMVRLKRRVDEGDIGRVLSLQAEYGQYLPDWRPQRNYRETYTARAGMGGGIILDGSHELDYARWLCGEVRGVYCSAGRFSSLEMDVEDIAEITLRMEKPLACQVHLDCVDRGYTRCCKLIGETGTLHWDVRTGTRRYDAGKKSWSDEPAPADLNSMFHAEMAHFLACVRGEESPRVDGAEGKRVLEIALAALRSAAERREVEGGVSGGVLLAIPARGGSKRLARKNLASLDGKPMIAHTIEAAIESGLSSEVWVATEDPEIARVAARHGARVFSIPLEMAGDEVSSTVPCLALHDDLRKKGAANDLIFNLQPTSPLRSAEDIRESHRTLIESRADFLVSVTFIDPHYFHWAVAEKGGGWEMYFGKEFLRERTQLPPVYRPNGAIKLARAARLKETGNYFGKPLAVHPMPEERSIHVATAFDLDCAGTMMARRARVPA